MGSCREVEVEVEVENMEREVDLLKLGQLSDNSGH